MQNSEHRSSPTPPARNTSPAPEAGMLLEHEVLRLLQLGDAREATTRVIFALQPRIRGFLRTMMGTDAEADDLCQEVACRITRALPSLQIHAETRLYAWALRIAQNLVVDIRRRRGRLHDHTVHFQTDDWHRIVGESGGAIDRHMDQQRRASQLRTALARLRERDRALLLLHAERDLSFRELGYVLNLSEETARVSYHRAKKRCMVLLQELCEEHQSPPGGLRAPISQEQRDRPSGSGPGCSRMP